MKRVSAAGDVLLAYWILAADIGGGRPRSWFLRRWPTPPADRPFTTPPRPTTTSIRPPPRAIYRYHAVDRNWVDIGYQYVVDQEGAPTSRTTMPAAASPATKAVATISGHCDWLATERPGGELYAQLPSIPLEREGADGDDHLDHDHDHDHHDNDHDDRGSGDRPACPAQGEGDPVRRPAAERCEHGVKEKHAVGTTTDTIWNQVKKDIRQV